MQLFDSHLHLDDPAFDPDRPAVVGRARDAGVVGMVTVGTGVESCARAIALAGEHPDIFAAVAIHPHDAADATDEAMAALRGMADHPRVVAVGETGLDFVRQTVPHERQREVFRAHIRLARAHDLPVLIHCREAYHEVLEILEEEGAEQVVMHAFSGSVEDARRCAARGYAVSLAGPVTYKNARATLDVAREVPIDLLLIETDAPVLPPEPFRGRRNEPAFLGHIAARIAGLRGLPPEDLAAVTTANAKRVYRVAGVA